MSRLFQAFSACPWLSSLGWALVHSLWEGALVTLSAALVLRGLRGSSPRARYLVAVMALLLFAGLPLRRLASGLATPSTPSIVVRQERGRPLQTATPVPGEAPDPPLRTRVVGDLERSLPWLVMTWGAGMLVFLLRLAGGWIWLQRLRWRKAELAPDLLQRQLLDLCRRAGLKRAVTLLTCQGLAGPSVVGFLRPAILVPAGWFLNLPPDHLEALLAHELAHVLRHDYAVNLLQSLLEVIFFYHPGLWWLSRQIRAEREMACDRFATLLMGDPLPLAEALTFLETRGLGRINLDPAPAAHGGSLMERIRQLLLPAPRTSSSPIFGATAALTLILASGLHLAAQGTPVAPGMPTNLALPPGVTVDWSATHLYLNVRHAKDAEGKAVPYTFLVDLVCNDVPLNQAWKAFQEQFQAMAGNDREVQSFARRDEKTAGPRITLDLKGVTPGEVQALLLREAKDHGVAPYQAPAPHEPGDFTVGKRTTEDGSTRFHLRARQVSTAYLTELLALARRLDSATDVRNGAVSNTRDKDTSAGPKVDAIFEDLPLPELEKRVNALIEGAR